MKPKIIRLISTLSQGELRAFTGRIKQLGKEPEITLLNQLYKMQKFSKEELDKVQIYKEVLPQAEEDEKDLKLRKLFNSLTKSLEDFLIDQKLKKDNALREYLLLSIMAEKGTSDLFEVHKKRTTKSILKKQSSEFPFLETWMRDLEYYHVSSTNQSKLFPTLKTLVNDFEKNFIRRRFFYRIEQLIFSKTYKVDLEDNVIWNQLQKWSDLKFASSPFINWLKELITLYNSNPNQDELKKLYRQYADYSSILSMHEKKMMFKLFINIAKGHLANQKKAYVQFIFKLYENAIEESILLQNGMLSPVQYLNITVIAAADKQFIWLKSFIQKSIDIPKRMREASENLAWAFYYYHLGNDNKEKNFYNRASKHIAMVSERNPLFSIRFYSLSIRIAYEIISNNDIDELYHRVIALKRYVTPKRSPLAEIHRKYYRNFADLVMQLGELKIQKKSSDASVEKFKEKIKRNNSVALKDWLLEKAEELN